MRTRLNLLNMKINSFTIVQELTDTSGKKLYLALCCCGKEVKKQWKRDFERVKSCGCLNTNKRKLYKDHCSIYRGMIYRCYNQRSRNFRNYGGRGIVVCDRWRESLLNFISDMGPRPSPNHSVDRIDVNGNYEPSNCRWATPSQQMNNTRVNVRLTFNGEVLNISQAANKYGLTKDTLFKRLKYGWSYDNAVNIPLGGKRNGNI